ncbi:MAG: type II toxin-antitoxin system RelE/ParE family toxin [Polyangiaceae bacterium]|nr:type II toxin-antitoxin system RelE/ParE family toxin [Polyangiaceae bacterium]
MTIRNFTRKAVEGFFLNGRIPRREGWSSVARTVRRKVARTVRRKLDVLDYATTLEDLMSPTGKRLEALRGDLLGLHSIRVNDQWRIVFRWTPEGPDEVDVCDYH